jgi:spore coat protein U-like protein
MARFRRVSARWLCVGVATMGVAFLTPSGPASAATASSSLTVSALVINSCIVTAGALVFGNYDPTASGNLDQNGTFTLTCTPGASGTIGLDTGQNASGSTRRMIFGTDHLSYELFKETGRTNVWGNSGGATQAFSSSSLLPQTFTVYGRVSPGQAVGAGAYLDTVAITVTF